MERAEEDERARGGRLNYPCTQAGLIILYRVVLNQVPLKFASKKIFFATCMQSFPPE